ncbi:MAG: shikimate dehydrogenase [Proteobacteria bacterium]|nr:shikimate dehydrogenase [Pseudomonadota bacterium]
MAEPGKFHLAAVLGWPVMHSRSPLMHNYWFDQQGLDGRYLPLAIEPGKIEPALRALHPLGFAGCNVTIPHKLEAMAALDDVDDVARKIGAVSCVVVNEDGSLFGTNNDWLGFLGNLKQALPDWRADAGPVAVIGAGGGSRAVCYGLISEGATEVRLVNRTREHADCLATDICGPIAVSPWEDRHDALEGAATVVNTTNQGMVGEPALDLRLDALPASAVVTDIIYTPLETPLLAQARERGHATVNGLGMLIHQGPPAWKRWFGIVPTVTAELRRLMEESIDGI